MIKLLKRLWDKVKYRFIAIDGIDNPVQQTTRQEAVRECTTQVCTRDAATRRRVYMAIKKQQKQMNMQALKAHDSSCKDPVFCKKAICFKQGSDKIVKKSSCIRMKTRGKLISGCTKKISE